MNKVNDTNDFAMSRALKPLLPLLVPQDELYLPEEDTAKASVDCQERQGRRPQLFPF